MSAPGTLRPYLDNLQTRSLVVGLAGAAALLAGAFLTPEQFYRSYLIGYLMWVGVALGSMGVLMIHHMVGGRWGVAIRRYVESGARTLPLMALLVLPLLAGIPHLYIWAQPEVVAKDAILQHKAPYLNVPFFVGRTVFYFAVWILFSILLNRWSAEQERADGPEVRTKLRNLSAPGMLVLGLTVTFAAFDWVMSLEPHWFSTVYGAMLITGQLLSTMAFAILCARLFTAEGPLEGTVDANQSHDLGNLLFAFNMLWAYIAFSQFLIIWSANLPEEITWYMKRMNGGWEVVAVVLLVFHFFLPFLILLVRRNKRKLAYLGKIAVAMLVMRVVDLFWLVAPAFSHGDEPSHFALHWLDIAAPVAVGGIWLAAFFWQLKRRPLSPVVAA